MKLYNLFFSFKLPFRLILLIAILFSFCPSAIAITPINEHPKKLTITRRKQQKTKPVYLLDWQENKLSTTAGDFMVDDEIEIIDENNVKEALSSESKQRHNRHKLHRVILKKEGRKLVRITIK